MGMTLQVRTLNEQHPPAGFDAVIIVVPRSWYAMVDGEPVLLLRPAGRALRAKSEQEAARLGEVLHHAEWRITSDRAEVAALGAVHDCAACRAGVDQALAWLTEHPAGEVAVGRVYWADQERSAT